MSAPGADASAAAAPEGAPATGKKKKLGKKERQRLRAIADGTYVAPVLPQKQPPKAKQARQPYNGGMAPSLLTKTIKEAWTTTALLETCERYQDRMNKIHASASWNCLGRLATAAADARWFERDRAALEALARKTTEMVLASVDVGAETAEDASANRIMGARELANVVHGLAKCGAARASDAPEKDVSSGTTFLDDDDDDLRPPPRERLRDARSRERDPQIDETTRNDANDANDPLRALIAALASALTDRAPECNAQEAANAAWAFRKLERDSDDFAATYEALASVARREAAKDAMNPQELVNAAWAFSGALQTLQSAPRSDDSRFAKAMASTVDALASSAAKRLPSFDARGVCVLTCALAKTTLQTRRSDSPSTGQSRAVSDCVRLLAAETASRVARAAEGAFSSSSSRGKEASPASCFFSARDVAASSWAFASLDFFDEALFAALARVSTAMCARDAFDARALANVAWAHAKANGGDEATRGALFRGVARALTRCASLNGGDAMTTVTEKPSFIRQNDPISIPPRDIANAAWAFAKACFPDDALFDALRACAARGDPSLERFNEQDLVNAAWAYAKLAARGAGALFASMRATVLARADADAFTAANITTLTWAMRGALADDADANADEPGGQDPNRVSFAFVSDALARAAARACVGSSASEIAATAWTFADAGAVRSNAHRDLFRALGTRVSAILDADASSAANEASSASFRDEELDNLEWAFSKAGNPGNVLKRVKAARRDLASGAKRGIEGGRGGFDPSADPASARFTNEAGPSNDAKKNASCGTIVVSGGGIGGAAAALALQRDGFDVTVLESDAAFDARKQGYGLTVQGTDLRDGLGIDLTADDAPSTSHYTFAADGSVLAFFGEAFGGKKNARVVPSGGSARFAHVPRQIMRLRMLERLKPGTVRWGAKMRSFRLNETAATETSSDAAAASRRAVTVELEDGSKLDACLLVGSDGIHSTTRRLLRLRGGGEGDAQLQTKSSYASEAARAPVCSNPDALTYVGLAVVLGIVDDATFRVRLAKRRVFETVDGRVRIYAMPFTASSTMWQLSFPCAETEARRFAKDPEALKTTIRALCADWHDPVPAMLERTMTENVAGYPVYDREPLDPETLRPRESKHRRVTLIGDAAHPMTPFKAQGANQAVADAVLLARCLSEHVRTQGENAAKGIDAALPVFEKRMLARSSRVVRASREKAREMHSPLALAPARKAQRESAERGDAARAVARCRAEGVCAAHARGEGALDLDEVVQAVGFGGKTLAQLGLPRGGGGLAPSGGTRTAEAKPAEEAKRAKRAKEETRGAKRERSPGPEAKKEKKAKKAKKEKKAKKAKKEKKEKKAKKEKKD